MSDNLDNIKNPSDESKAENLVSHPENVSENHVNKHDDKNLKKGGSDGNHYSLNDDRRVKTISPGALVAKRFFRSKLAVTGLIVLVIMFLFSFVGGLISPYSEKQLFYREDVQLKDFAGVVENNEFRYAAADSTKFNSVIQAQATLAMQQNKDTFSYRDVNYSLAEEGKDLYSVSQGDEVIGIAYKDILTMSASDAKEDFFLTYNALKAYANDETTFTYGDREYTIDDEGLVLDGDTEVAYISRYVVRAIMPDVFLSRDFMLSVVDSIENKSDKFVYTEEDGSESEYILAFDASKDVWSVRQNRSTRVFDIYSGPSAEHWLGTDGNGMDILTRIMYGGRVSLMIGFIVVFIETFIGVIMGGIAGYFGGWVDNIIMRVVDIFYCIPSMPIIIILGAAMDAMRVDPWIRMIYLMLLLGFLGWPGIARLVRGQILSLREQEFMMATEACGIGVSRRIFKHLIPNVIPQLIVTCTMGLGSTIITEATLSFLGLGVKFPFASWGNIINDVTNTHVLTSYWFVWIPASICLLLTVLAFNLVGDGLRDAFDPRMKR